MTFDVKIHKLIDNGLPLKATATVTIDGGYAVHNVRVIKTDKGTFMGMPFESYKDKDGNEKRKDVFHPITSEAILYERKRDLRSLCSSDRRLSTVRDYSPGSYGVHQR